MKTQLLNLISALSDSKTVGHAIGDFINSLISGMGSGSVGLYSVSVMLKTATGKERSGMVGDRTCSRNRLFTLSLARSGQLWTQLLKRPGCCKQAEARDQEKCLKKLNEEAEQAWFQKSNSESEYQMAF